MKKIKITIIWIILLSPFFSVFVLINLTSVEFFGKLPTFNQLENPKNNLATEVFSEDGVVLGSYFLESLI